MSIEMLAAAFVALLAPQEPVLLRRTWTVGNSDVYINETKMVQTVELPGGLGEQEITYTQRARVTYKVTGSDASGFTVDVTTETLDMKMESSMGMPMPEMPKMPPVTMATRADIMNKMQGGKGAGFDMSAMYSAGAAFLFPRFPSQAVKVGDTWTLSSAEGTKPAKPDEDITFTFAELGEHEGVPAYRISFKGKLPLKVNSKQMGQQSPMGPMEVSGFTTGEGSAWIERSTGKTLSVDMDMGSEMTTSAGGMDIGIKGTGKTTMKIEK